MVDKQLIYNILVDYSIVINYQFTTVLLNCLALKRKREMKVIDF